MYSKKDRKINGRSGIGQSLINSRKRQKKEKFFDDAKFFHPDDEEIQEKIDKDKMKSVIDQNSLVEYMQLSTLANKNFDATKQAELVQEVGGKKVIDYTSAKLRQDASKLGVDRDDEILRRLRLPRRPDWRQHIGDRDTLKAQENLNFVNWRKELSEMEQSRPDLIITPYEKNIEIWRQLWRVCENSHLLLQIVDGRDPLFYRCEDLEQYLQELDGLALQTKQGLQARKSWLVINKADLLSDEIRAIWADYLRSNHIPFVFFSAFKEQQKILKEEQRLRNNQKVALENKDRKEEQLRKEDEGQDVLDLLRLDDEIDQQHQEDRQAEEKENVEEEQEVMALLQEWKPTLSSDQVLNKEQLLGLLSQFEGDYRGEHCLSLETKVQIGTVGYPNVGKSSVINVLCDKKVVSVANMPGKTRHLQTYDVGPSLRVCDCPGLVFPSTKKSSRAGLVLAGVLPVHQMRDYIAPIDLLLKKVPYTILNLYYHMSIIDKHISGRTMLETFGRLRGYHAGGAHGGYDLSRASRQILLDYLSGQLLFVELPPGVDNSDKKVNQSNWSFDDTWRQMNQIEEQDRQRQAQVQKDREDGLVDQETFFDQESQLQMIDALAAQLTDDDILALLEGKKVRQIKFDKNLRREIKHMIKREEDIDIHEVLSREGVIINNQKLQSIAMKSGDTAMYKNKGKIHARF